MPVTYAKVKTYYTDKTETSSASYEPVVTKPTAAGGSVKIYYDLHVKYATNRKRVTEPFIQRKEYYSPEGKLQRMEKWSSVQHGRSGKIRKISDINYLTGQTQKYEVPSPTTLTVTEQAQQKVKLAKLAQARGEAVSIDKPPKPITGRDLMVVGQKVRRGEPLPEGWEMVKAKPQKVTGRTLLGPRVQRERAQRASDKITESLYAGGERFGIRPQTYQPTKDEIQSRGVHIPDPKTYTIQLPKPKKEKVQGSLFEGGKQYGILPQTYQPTKDEIQSRGVHIPDPKTYTIQTPPPPRGAIERAIGWTESRIQKGLDVTPTWVKRTVPPVIFWDKYPESARTIKKYTTKFDIATKGMPSTASILGIRKPPLVPTTLTQTYTAVVPQTRTEAGIFLGLGIAFGAASRGIQALKPVAKRAGTIAKAKFPKIKFYSPKPNPVIQLTIKHEAKPGAWISKKLMPITKPVRERVITPAKIKYYNVKTAWKESEIIIEKYPSKNLLSLRITKSPTPKNYGIKLKIKPSEPGVFNIVRKPSKGGLGIVPKKKPVVSFKLKLTPSKPAKLSVRKVTEVGVPYTKTGIRILPDKFKAKLPRFKAQIFSSTGKKIGTARWSPRNLLPGKPSPSRITLKIKKSAKGIFKIRKKTSKKGIGIIKEKKPFINIIREKSWPKIRYLRTPKKPTLKIKVVKDEFPATPLFRFFKTEPKMRTYTWRFGKAKPKLLTYEPRTGKPPRYGWMRKEGKPYLTTWKEAEEWGVEQARRQYIRKARRKGFKLASGEYVHPKVKIAKREALYRKSLSLVKKRKPGALEHYVAGVKSEVKKTGQVVVDMPGGQSLIMMPPKTKVKVRPKQVLKPKLKARVKVKSPKTRVATTPRLYAGPGMGSVLAMRQLQNIMMAGKNKSEQGVKPKLRSKMVQKSGLGVAQAQSVGVGVMQYAGIKQALVFKQAQTQAQAQAQLVRQVSAQKSAQQGLLQQELIFKSPKTKRGTLLFKMPKLGDTPWKKKRKARRGYEERVYKLGGLRL